MIKGDADYLKDRTKAAQLIMTFKDGRYHNLTSNPIRLSNSPELLAEGCWFCHRGFEPPDIVYPVEGEHGIYIGIVCKECFLTHHDPTKNENLI